MMCTVLLFVVAVAYSGAVTAVGRRLPRPASVTAYGTALAIFIAVPLLPDPNAQVVDRVLLVVGAGRLLVHLAFMTALSGLLVTIVLATNRWSPRHRLVVSGASALTVGFVLLWLQVRALPLADIAAVLYGLRAGRPLPVLWMNIVMGAGIVYNAVWGLREFQQFPLLTL